MAKNEAVEGQFLKDLREDLKDPEFAREYEEAAREIRARIAEQREQEAQKNPAVRYEDTPNLEEVDGWSDELHERDQELQAQAEASTDPEEKEHRFRRAWRLRVASEHA